jgi:hypothetical protein
MISQRLTNLEQRLKPNRPTPRMFYYGDDETEQQATDRYNQLHGTSYKPEQINLIAIVFTNDIEGV